MSFHKHYLSFYIMLLVNLKIRERQSFFEETISRSVLHQLKEGLYTYFIEAHDTFSPIKHEVVSVIKILMASFELDEE